MAQTHHKVKTRHQENQIRQEQPVPLEDDLAFLEERLRNVPAGGADELALLKGLRLGQQEAGDDDEDGGTGAEPEQRTPAVRGRVDQAPREDGGQEVSKGVALLQHAGDDAAGLFGAVLERRGRGVTVQAAHGDAKEGPAGEKLRVSLREAGPLGETGSARGHDSARSTARSRRLPGLPTSSRIINSTLLITKGHLRP